MSLPPLPELLPAVLSVIAALPAGAPAAERWPVRIRAGLRGGALLLLAAAGLEAGQGAVLPAPVALLALAEAALAGGETAAGLAFAPHLLAEAGWLVLFFRLGGGAPLLRLEPVRLAGVLSSVSAGVFIIRRFARRLGPAAGPFIISTLALAASAAMSFTLPLARWPAMAGAVLLLGGRGVQAEALGRAPEARTWLGGFWLRYSGAAAILAAFTLPLAA